MRSLCRRFHQRDIPVGAVVRYHGFSKLVDDLHGQNIRLSGLDLEPGGDTYIDLP